MVFFSNKFVAIPALLQLLSPAETCAKQMLSGYLLHIQAAVQAKIMLCAARQMSRAMQACVRKATME